MYRNMLQLEKTLITIYFCFLNVVCFGSVFRTEKVIHQYGTNTIITNHTIANYNYFVEKLCSTGNCFDTIRTKYPIPITLSCVVQNIGNIWGTFLPQANHPCVVKKPVCIAQLPVHRARYVLCNELAAVRIQRDFSCRPVRRPKSRFKRRVLILGVRLEQVRE